MKKLFIIEEIAKPPVLLGARASSPRLSRRHGRAARVPRGFVISSIFILLIAATRLCAANTALLNDGAITVGDDIAIQVNADGFDLALLNDDAFSGLNIGDFMLRSVSINDDGSLTLILAAFKTGELSLDSFEIPFSDGKNLETSPLIIEVKSVLDPDNPPVDILDIMPIIIFTRGILPYLLIAAAIIITAAAVYAIVKYLKNKKPLRPAQDPEVLLPPREFALQELEKLKSLRLIEQGSAKEHYDRLSDIVRRYISRVYAVDLMEKTTFEIYGILKTTISQSDNVMLKNFLQTCDFVKFAKVVPAAEGAESDFAAARGFVESL